MSKTGKSAYRAPWTVHRGKLQDKVSSHQHAPIDEPFAPRVPILWGWVLEDRVHRRGHPGIYGAEQIVSFLPESSYNRQGFPFDTT